MASEATGISPSSMPSNISPKNAATSTIKRARAESSLALAIASVRSRVMNRVLEVSLETGLRS